MVYFFLLLLLRGSLLDIKKLYQNGLYSKWVIWAIGTNRRKTRKGFYKIYWVTKKKQIKTNKRNKTKEKEHIYFLLKFLQFLFILKIRTKYCNTMAFAIKKSTHYISSSNVSQTCYPKRFVSAGVFPDPWY